VREREREIDRERERGREREKPTTYFIFLVIIHTIEVSPTTYVECERASFAFIRVRLVNHRVVVAFERGDRKFVESGCDPEGFENTERERGAIRGSLYVRKPVPKSL